MQTSAQTAMACDRCQGHLVREHIYREGAWWWRCYNCGGRIDGAILLNRAEQEVAEAQQRAAMERDCQEWAAWFARMPPDHVVAVNK